MALANPTAEFPVPPQAGSQSGDVSPAAPTRTGNATAEANLFRPRSQTFVDVRTWLRLFKKRPGKLNIRANEIRDSIASFDKFCEEYTERLSALAPRTRKDWLESTIDNVLMDYWEPILRSTEQNRSPHYRPLFKKGYEKLDGMKADLEKRLKIPELDVHLVLYFDRIGKASRYPFGKTYLIGVPLIDAYRGDWTSIPHELGHHLFWKAQFSTSDTALTAAPGKNVLEEELASAMQTLKLAADDPARKVIKKILHDWTEELFADVVGARIAGQAFVDGAWKKISRQVEDKHQLFQTDGDHPIPYLVPYIRSIAAGVTDFEDKWQELEFGPLQFSRLVSKPEDNMQDEVPVIQIADLQDATKEYVLNIMKRLRRIKISDVVEDESSMAKLESFAALVRKELERQQPVIPPEEDELRKLLKPYFLVKGGDWICEGGHANSPNVNVCPRCNDRRSWWPFWQPG